MKSYRSIASAYALWDGLGLSDIGMIQRFVRYKMIIDDTSCYNFGVCSCKQNLSRSLFYTSRRRFYETTRVAEIYTDGYVPYELLLPSKSLHFKSICSCSLKSRTLYGLDITVNPFERACSKRHTGKMTG
jgi:hypothetical protein